MSELITRDELNVDSEEIIFNAVMRYWSFFRGVYIFNEELPPLPLLFSFIMIGILWMSMKIIGKKGSISLDLKAQLKNTFF